MFDNEEPRQGRKTLFGNDFLSPFQGSWYRISYRGLASLNPGYFLVALRGLSFNRVSRQKLVSSNVEGIP
jgi:hypothetical protein